MIRMLMSATMIFLLMIVGAQAAGDPVAGKAKAASCAACHGANGQGFRQILHSLGKPRLSFSRNWKTTNRVSATMQ